MKNLKEKPVLWEKGADSTPEAVATPTVTTIKAQLDDEHVGRTEGQSIGEINDNKDNALLSYNQEKGGGSSKGYNNTPAMGAEARLEEYTEKMKAELAEKEAKYADIDATVEASEDVAFVEDKEEERDTTQLLRFAGSSEELKALPEVMARAWRRRCIRTI